MLIVFIFMPLALASGFLIGLITARWGKGAGIREWFQRLLKALGISGLIIAAVTCVAWTTAMHAPTIKGRELKLEYEVRLPSGFPIQSDFENNEFRVGLTASADDRSYTEIDFAHIESRDGFVVVPGSAHLNSKSSDRTISVTYGPFDRESKAAQFIDIPLSPSPSEKDFEWSPWLGKAKGYKLSDVPVEMSFQVRYRIRFAS